jgi:hypothetical protein
VLSPFWFVPSGRKKVGIFGLRVLAAAVIVASLAAGLAALREDLRLAYLWATPSIFKDLDRKEMAAVRDSVPEGAVLMLVAKPTDGWHARLWQRGMFPRNPVAVILEPVPEETVRALRERYAIRYAVLIGPPSQDPGLLWRRDLGPLPNLPGRVYFGELAP